MSLVKITGRDVVTAQEPRTRQVWVDDPVSPPVDPPVTPPVTLPPSTPPIPKRFVGEISLQCVNAAGQPGVMIARIDINGVITPLSSCLVPG